MYIIFTDGDDALLTITEGAGGVEVENPIDTASVAVDIETVRTFFEGKLPIMSADVADIETDKVLRLNTLQDISAGVDNAQVYHTQLYDGLENDTAIEVLPAGVVTALTNINAL